jgi:hypothetical protein
MGKSNGQVKEVGQVGATPLTRDSMTTPVAVEILGGLVVRQLIEYGHVTFHINPQDEGVHLVEPWRVSIDGKPQPLPPHALLDALTDEAATERMIEQGMTDQDIILALHERNRRTAAKQ